MRKFQQDSVSFKPGQRTRVKQIGKNKTNPDFMFDSDIIDLRELNRKPDDLLAGYGIANQSQPPPPTERFLLGNRHIQKLSNQATELLIKFNIFPSP